MPWRSSDERHAPRVPRRLAGAAVLTALDVLGTRFGAPAAQSELPWELDWRLFRRLPCLRRRPEVRWDHSFDGPLLDLGRYKDQVPLALDVLLTF